MDHPSEKSTRVSETSAEADDAGSGGFRSRGLSFLSRKGSRRTSKDGEATLLKEAAAQGGSNVSPTMARRASWQKRKSHTDLDVPVRKVSGSQIPPSADIPEGGTHGYPEDREEIDAFNPDAHDAHIKRWGSMNLIEQGSLAAELHKPATSLSTSPTQGMANEVVSAVAHRADLHGANIKRTRSIGSLGRFFGGKHKEKEKEKEKDGKDSKDGKEPMKDSKDSKDAHAKREDSTGDVPRKKNRSTLEEKLAVVALRLSSAEQSDNPGYRAAEHRWTDWFSPEAISALSKNAVMLHECIWEVYSSEATFYDHLGVLQSIFLGSLRDIQSEDGLLDIDADAIFGNIGAIRETSGKFLSLLEPVALPYATVVAAEELSTERRRTLSDPPQKAKDTRDVRTDDVAGLSKSAHAGHTHGLHPNAHGHSKGISRTPSGSRDTDKPIGLYTLASAFKGFADRFEPYFQYGINYKQGGVYLKSLEDRADFQTWLKWCESHPACKRLKLTDLLVEPMQRVTRYPLLLKTVLGNVAEGSPGRPVIAKAVEITEQFASRLNSMVWHRDNEAKLFEIQQLIDWQSVIDESPIDYVPSFISEYVRDRRLVILARSDRRFLLEGKLSRVVGGGTNVVDLHAYLLSDMLLLTKLKKKRMVLVRRPLAMTSLRAWDIAEDAGG
eukprot:Opistho-2@738